MSTPDSASSSKMVAEPVMAPPSTSAPAATPMVAISAKDLKDLAAIIASTLKAGKEEKNPGANTNDMKKERALDEKYYRRVEV